jgi:hypothetical protein
MNTFKNFVLKREINNIIESIDSLEFGEVGGCSIEIVTNTPLSFESYLYQGKTAESDRNHDFEILREMLKKTTN